MEASSLNIETSLYDEWGSMRKDFGLSKLFGCSYAGEVQRRMQNSYLSRSSTPRDIRCSKASKILRE